MNVTERAALVQGVELYGEMTAMVDERTLDILDRRRRTATVRHRGWLVRRALLAADLLGLVLAMFLAEWLVNRHSDLGVLNARAEVVVFLASLPGWVVVAKISGLYDHDEERTDHSTTDDFSGVFQVVTVCTWLFIASAHVTGLAQPNTSKLLIFWASAVAFVSCGRGIARTVVRRSVAYVQNTIIVGAGEIGQLIAKKLLQHPEYGINLVGFIDGHPKERREDLEHLSLLGGTDRLNAIVRLFDVERVIIAFSNEHHENTLELVRSLKDLDVQIDVVPRLFELVGPGVGIHTIEGLPLVGLPPLRLSRSSRFLKRLLDLVISCALLGLLSPALALIGLAIVVDSRGPVLFRQTRMGARESTFRILKFRSMILDADARKQEVAHLNRHLDAGGDPRMFKVPDDPRVTRVGKFLRRFSLDELPQLVNVVRGEMSLVGPRPLILDEDRFVDDWARRRLVLKPGITGLWQVLGRADIPFAEMVRLDYLYVTTWSLWGDVRLAARTIPVLARSQRAS